MKGEREEALRRLGVTLVDCAQCGNRFNLRHTPRHWVQKFVEEGTSFPAGDTADDYLLCSEACAFAYRDEKRRDAPNGVCYEAEIEVELSPR